MVAATLPEPEKRTAAAYLLGSRLLGARTLLDARSGFAVPFIKVASTLEDAAVLNTVASILLERLANLADPAATGDFRSFDQLTGSYASVVAALGQPPSRAAVAKRIGLLLQAHAREGGNDIEELARLYGSFMPLGSEDARTEAEALLTDLQQDPIMPVPAGSDGNPLAGEEANARRQEKAADRRFALATAFAAVTKDLAGVYAERGERVLHPWMESLSNGRLSEPYIELAGRLRDPSALESAAHTLREEIAREAAAHSGASEEAKIDNLTEAYGTVTSRIESQRVVLREADALWRLIDQPPDGRTTSSLADLYASIASRITDPSYLAAAVRTIDGRLLTAATFDDAAPFATALAAVAGACLRLPEAAHPACPPIPETVLIAAGHPFVGDPTSLLAVIEPGAGRRYGSDLGAAVSDWAAKGGHPTTLRPQPADVALSP